MPSNDDLKHQNEGEAKGRTSSDASVASVSPDVHMAGAGETSANEASGPLLSSDDGMPQEFTFFQKRNVRIKRLWPHLWLLQAPRR